MAGQGGIVSGERCRFTDTGRCGLPVEGAAGTYVTKSLVSVQETPNMKESEKKVSTSASGEECVVHNTPPQLLDIGVTITLCGVDFYVLSYLGSITRVIDEAGDPEGYFTERDIDPDAALGLEVWNAVGDGAQCADTPLDDSFFEQVNAGRTARGYHVWPAITNLQLSGEVTYGNDVANLTLTGTAKFAPYWGRGPYNVRLNANTGTPDRLLVPFSNTRASYHGVTFLAPPEVTPEPIALTRPEPYFGPVTP